MGILVIYLFIFLLLSFILQKETSGVVTMKIIPNLQSHSKACEVILSAAEHGLVFFFFLFRLNWILTYLGFFSIYLFPFFNFLKCFCSLLGESSISQWTIKVTIKMNDITHISVASLCLKPLVVCFPILLWYYKVVAELKAYI